VAWIVFSYTLPAKARSSARVALWRRLRRLGAISPAGGVYVLPVREECAEGFQWLAQEIRQANGEALVMRVEQFEGLTDEQLIALFNAARKEEYAPVDAHAAALEKQLTTKNRAPLQAALDKLRRQHAEIARIDYFDCPEGIRVGARLAKITESRAPSLAVAENISSERVKEFRGKRWVTRPRPHVDRLACAWLIRRFIDSSAPIRYAQQPKPNEIAFDMEGGKFGHRGNLCTFETMMNAFGLSEPAVRAMSQVIHEIDLRDGKYASQPAVEGIDFVLKGWLLADLSDAELETRGVALFEGLYNYFSQTPSAKTNSSRRPRRDHREKK
jgi:hypothetical protein